MAEEPRYSGILVDNYDTLLQAWPHSEEMHEAVGIQIAVYFSDPKKKRINVVEVGSGRGEATKHILEYDPRTHVIAIDPSEEMQRELEKRLGIYIQQNRLFPLRAKVLDSLELCGDQMDVLTSSWTMHNFPREERNKILRTAYEGMHPGGMYVCMDKFLSDSPKEEKRSLQRAIENYQFASCTYNWPAGLCEAIIAHEVEDHKDPYAMREFEAVEDLRNAGFVGVKVVKRMERDALVVAYKK